MKNRLFNVLMGCMLVIALFPTKVHAEGIVLNSDNFPDANMLTAVTTYDTSNDGVLDADEIAAVTLLDLNDKDLTDLTGIKFFTSATIIWLENNLFTAADLSGMTNVEQIVFDYTYSMTSLNITGCSNLDILSTRRTGITSLNLTGTPLMNAVIEKGSATGPDTYDLDFITNKPITYCYKSNDGTVSLVVPIGTTFGTKVDETPATHTSDGVKEHYVLGAHYYEDGACLTELEDIVIPKTTEHTYDTYTLVDLNTHLKKCACGDEVPEAHTFGADHSCTGCSFMDYPILEGENPEVTIGSETEVRVRSEGAFSNFIAIDIDDNDVGSENYTKEEGSTIITLSKSYVQTLSAGTHTINFHFTNGKSSTNLVIKAAPVVTPAPTPTPTATATITQPQTTTAVTTPVEESRTITIPLTSDQSDLAAWMGMLMISISGMIISLVLNNKKLFR